MVDDLKAELSKYQSESDVFQYGRENIIKEVPVYIEKEVIVEVPVPIYITRQDNMGINSD